MCALFQFVNAFSQRSIHSKELVRLIQDVHANFFADHVLLVLQILFADIQRAHPIGFQPQAHLDAIARQRLVIVGVVEIGMAVQIAAVGFDKFRVLELLHVGRALKHHVLEEVRKAGAALRLDAKADVVINAHRDHRRHVIFRDHDLQTVRQFVIDHRHFDWLG